MLGLFVVLGISRRGWSYILVLGINSVDVVIGPGTGYTVRCLEGKVREWTVEPHPHLPVAANFGGPKISTPSSLGEGRPYN